VKSRRQIALLMDIRTAYDHGVVRGIMRFARERGTWRLFGQGWTLAQMGEPHAWGGHGIITRVHAPGEVPALLAFGVPVVDVCRSSPHPRVHSAANDDVLTGRLVGEYFLRAGHHRFACCGANDGEWSVRRASGFAAAVKVPMARMPLFQRQRAWWYRPQRAPRALKDWLRRLDRPVAILACDDAIGVKLTAACAELGLRVPDDVAIVGVDNEEVLCQLADPPLSSIPCDTERMGYQAAALLDRLIDEGEPAQARHVAVPPLPIVTRESSNRFATTDPALLAALRHIHYGPPAARVPEVVAASGLSRRSLEQRFRGQLARTILDEIRQARLERACRLLSTTDQALAAVAQASGFGSAQRLHLEFNARFAMSPSDWRRQQAGRDWQAAEKAPG
jgi:LacI family transcriptional regulator